MENQNEVSPAFQLYAANIIANPNWRRMNAEERGIFFSIYINCWTCQRLPADLEELSLWVGIKIKNISSNVMNFFNIENGWLTCPSLEKYREQQNARKQKMSEGGKKAMAKRYSKKEKTEVAKIIEMQRAE